MKTETILKDADGDTLELLHLEDGVYITVDQGGIIATVGPFPEGLTL